MIVTKRLNLKILSIQTKAIRSLLQIKRKNKINAICFFIFFQEEDTMVFDPIALYRDMVGKELINIGYDIKDIDAVFKQLYCWSYEWI